MLFTYSSRKGRYRKELLNPVPGPESGSAVWWILPSLTFYFTYVFVCVMSISFTII